MQRNRFLGDMLSQLFDRRNFKRGKDDTRDIFELCQALLSAKGEVSSLRLAATILARYADLESDEKTAFFHYLNSELDIDAAAIAALAAQYQATPTPEVFHQLSTASEPKRQEFLRRLNQPVGATAERVAMRVDLLALNKWLATQIDDETHGTTARSILNGIAATEDMRAMAARYFLQAKRDDGMPVDPVARFHLGNDAEIDDIHAGADTSPNGLAQSSGAMVNYLYDLGQTERNHESYALAATVTASRAVRALSTLTLPTKTGEPTP
jgi:hypothetical protein